MRDRQGRRKHQKTKDCQSFIYKAFDDPTALFTGGLFLFTVALAVSTIGLFLVTKAGIVEQGLVTHRFFVLDQRPRLKISMQTSDPVFDFGSLSDIEISVVITVENIGKTPAMEVASAEPAYEYQRFEPNPQALEVAMSGGRKKTYNTAIERVRDRVRAEVKNYFLAPSQIIYPGDKPTFARKVKISRSIITKAWNELNAGEVVSHHHFVIVSIPYRNSFDHSEYETTMVYILDYGGLSLGMIPGKREDIEDYRRMASQAFVSGLEEMFSSELRVRIISSCCIIT